MGFFVLAILVYLFRGFDTRPSFLMSMLSWPYSLLCATGYRRFLFQRDIGLVTPCDMFLLKTPLLSKGKGQTNHADACEKFVCPNYIIAWSNSALKIHS